MLEERLLKILIREVIQEEIKLRGRKGYNASHPVVNRKPFLMGLGKSEFEEDNMKKKNRKNKKKKDVEVSKAFEKDSLEEYESILEGLLNATDLY